MPPTPSPEALVLTGAVLFLAGLLQGASGFGYGIAAMSLLPYFIHPKIAVVYVGVLAPLVSGHLLLSLRRHVSWRRILLVYGAYLAIGLPLGLWIFGAADARILKQIVGASLAAGCAALWLATGSKTYALPRWLGLPTGALSGLLSGVAGVGGPPVVVYMWLQDITKEEASGTLQAYFTLGNLTKLAGFCALAAVHWKGYELVTLKNCLTALVFWPGLAIGCWLGLRLFHKIDAEKIRRTAYALVIVAGVVMFLKAALAAHP